MEIKESTQTILAPRRGQESTQLFHRVSARTIQTNLCPLPRHLAHGNCVSDRHLLFIESECVCVLLFHLFAVVLCYFIFYTVRGTLGS